MIETAAGSLLPFMVKGAFYLLLFMFTCYSGFMIYHWYAYGTSKNTAGRAVVLYLSISALCFLIMLLSMNQIIPRIATL